MTHRTKDRSAFSSQACAALLAINLCIGVGCEPSRLEAWNRNLATGSSAQALVPALDVATTCETLPPSTATYLYVSGSTGNNSTAIASDRTRPWATINGALGQVPATLNNTYAIEIIDSSTYNETLNISGKTTSATNTLIFRTAVGAAPVVNNGGTATPVTISTNYTTLLGLTITGSTSFDGVVLSAATAGNSVLCNTITGNKRAIVASAGTQTSLTIEGNRIESNDQGGISLATGTSSLVVRRNVIDNNGTTNASTGPALNLTTATSPLIVNNTFYNNGGASGDPTTSPDLNITTSSAVQIKNNIFSSPTSSVNKRSISVDTGASISSSSQYNIYWYPNVCTGLQTCPNCGDNFSVGGLCNCWKPNGGACGGSCSWQCNTGADTTGSNRADPRFVAADATPPDLHEQSTGGHWTAGGYVVDSVLSPAVDTGNPADSVGSEPTPNGPPTGPRINCGAYGGGPQASKSPGTRVMVLRSSGTAGTPLTVQIQVQDASGNLVTTHPTFTANVVLSSGTATPTPSSIVIRNHTSQTTIQVSDTVAEDVVVSLDETPAPGTTGLVPAPGTITFAPTALVEVSVLTAVSGPNTNSLLWNNPGVHDGVLVLRSTAGVPNTVPTNGVNYAVGAVLGNATVLYNDSQSFAPRITDQGLTNGTRYYYRVFNHDKYFVYSAGNVPSSSGVFSEPTSRVSPAPLYCYSVGFPTLIQPVTELNTAVYSASNSYGISANNTSSTVSLDGQERWRPSILSGAAQARFPVVALQGRAGNYILVGDQAGKAYALNSSTGARIWTANGGTALGDAIQAQVGVQLYAFANAAFQAANPNRDLVFVPTRNNSSTNNKLYALSSVDGSVVWTYAPPTMDIASGGVLVDYTNNRLWLGVRAGGSNQPSLHVINSLTGAAVTTFQLGDIDLPINRDSQSNQAYVTTNAGVAYGYDLDSMSQKWSFNTGTLNAYVFPVGNGFIASIKGPPGQVQWYAVNPSSGQVTPVWSAAVPIAGPTGVRIDYVNQKIFVGSSDGKIHQIDVTTGVDEKQLTVSTQQLGTPTIDTTANRLAVGGMDGRLCAFQLPLP